jgi:hypothetical protein
MTVSVSVSVCAARSPGSSKKQHNQTSAYHGALDGV